MQISMLMFLLQFNEAQLNNRISIVFIPVLLVNESEDDKHQYVFLIQGKWQG